MAHFKANIAGLERMRDYLRIVNAFRAMSDDEFDRKTNYLHPDTKRDMSRVIPLLRNRFRSQWGRNMERIAGVRR